MHYSSGKPHEQPPQKASGMWGKYCKHSCTCCLRELTAKPNLQLDLGSCQDPRLVRGFVSEQFLAG